GGGVLEFAASVSAASLPELTAGTRGGKIVVPDGCTVTLSAPPVDDGGTIDVDLQGSGRIFCPAAAGRLFPFFTVGGLTGVFKADGELFGDKYPEIETLIAARGGVVPDGASVKVAIALPGEESLGPVTLARSACEAELLVQKADVPATVALGGGTFSIGTLSMLSRTGGLTIGAAVGDGILQAGGVLTLENYSRDTALTVNSTLTAADGGSRLVKTGCGDAVVADLAGTWSAEPAEGRLTLSGKGDFDLTAAVSGGARLALKDIADDAGASTPDAVSGFLVGGGGDGILEIGPGTAMTNRLYVGYGGVGAVYQTGGYFFNRFAGGDVLLRPGIGYDGYGYYELRGGVYAEGGGIRQMCATLNSVGVLDVYGGAVKATGTDQLWMNAKAGAVGVIVLRGGSYEVKGIARVPDNKGVFCFTQEGEDSVASFNTLEMGCVSDSTSIVNLNGGVFSAEEVCRRNVSGTVSVFNFNGGTMKARNDKPLFRAYSSRVMIDHVVSYGRGAAFDTNGNNVELGMPVKAPSGLGVVSIVWTAADAEENRYIGAPAVVISGDGFGATACADFDFRSGCVTNIRVTCSGSGYTQGNVSATLRYGSAKRQLQVTLSPVVPGGIIKKGRGTLTLDNANSYAGETAVEAGTLKAGTAGAIPSGGALRLDGGVLDLNGHAPTFPASAD
ncbi:MAG: autotransporter-associated beta strand repeat-containing protein, partial [Kiritimatiellae bacterium]|nr:autotransporter-associated beta strand repeat-containing protein [Kiritimatiellia bacterium]